MDNQTPYIPETKVVRLTRLMNEVIQDITGRRETPRRGISTAWHTLSQLNPSRLEGLEEHYDTYMRWRTEQQTVHPSAIDRSLDKLIEAFSREVAAS